jgi:dTDP-4-dehydrorhamnose 3,5-epimerase-like enzyme
MKFHIKDIKKFKIKNIQNKKSLISVISKKDIPVKNFERIFFVSSNKNKIRGNHAHKKCNQFMFALVGKIKLICDDGLKKKQFILNSKKNGILVPPTIWAKQKYLIKNSVLGVICDRNFEEQDYIRNYKKFKKIYKL